MTFKEKFNDIVFTKYRKGVPEKERRLKNLYEKHGKRYSRQLVKDEHYSQYKAKGGWRPKEGFSDWIFEE